MPGNYQSTQASGGVQIDGGVDRVTLCEDHTIRLYLKVPSRNSPSVVAL